VKEATFLPGGSWRTIDVPALFALVRHPRAGVVLFDTGYSPRFHEATRAFPNRVYRWLTPVQVTDEETAAAQLRAKGIDPAEVRLIVLSHFDPDHYGGLLDFPNARVACSWRAWESVAGKTGLDALKMRVLPGHLPGDLAARIDVLPDPDGPAFGPFDATLDLLGDGAVRLVALPGHAPGQMGAFVALEDGSEMFLAADGCWSRANVDGETIRGGVHRVMAHDKPGQDDTYRRLHRLIREHPEIQVVPAHCPKAAADVLAR
jgi:glyoxylase-like metal-dependent hydrolase (beta-lactamase superfamily II)